MSDDIVARETRSIIESLGIILSHKKHLIKELPPSDQKMMALSGEMLGKMLEVGNHDDSEYLIDLLRAAEDSFIENKMLWIDVLAANQEKVIGVFAGGLIG